MLKKKTSTIRGLFFLTIHQKVKYILVLINNYFYISSIKRKFKAKK